MITKALAVILGSEAIQLIDKKKNTAKRQIRSNIDNQIQAFKCKSVDIDPNSWLHLSKENLAYATGQLLENAPEKVFSGNLNFLGKLLEKRSIKLWDILMQRPIQILRSKETSSNQYFHSE